MTKVAESLEGINFQDQHFVGTIALKSEDITLPDGSKMALGIDGSHWVLIYQKEETFKLFQYFQKNNSIKVDHNDGTAKDLEQFKKLVNYFLASAHTEQLVTYIPPQ